MVFFNAFLLIVWPNVLFYVFHSSIFLPFIWNVILMLYNLPSSSVMKYVIWLIILHCGAFPVNMHSYLIPNYMTVLHSFNKLFDPKWLHPCVHPCGYKPKTQMILTVTENAWMDVWIKTLLTPTYTACQCRTSHLLHRQQNYNYKINPLTAKGLQSGFTS